MTIATNKSFTLQLKVLSPLAINNGEKLSPLVDYYIERNQLNYLDLDKFSDLFEGDEDLLDKFQGKVMQTRISGAGDFLREFSDDNNIDLNSTHSVPFRGSSRIQLASIIKNHNNEPYIPGSSIKGAISNCYLYYWLTKTDEGTKKLSSFMEGLKRDLDYKEDKENKKSIEVFVQKAQDFALDIHDKKDKLRQAMSNLLISDSNTNPVNKVEVGELNRKSLDGADWVLSLQEYVVQDTCFEVNIKVNSCDLDWHGLEDSNLAKVLRADDLKELLAIIQQFHADSTELYKQLFGYQFPDFYPPVTPNVTILHLGSGKGIFRNTILMAIKNYCDNNALDFKMQIIPLFYNKAPNLDEFPNSYSYIGSAPIGWVQVTELKAKIAVNGTTITNGQTTANENVPRKSYTEDELKTGNAIEASFMGFNRPYAKVRVNVNGVITPYEVSGYKNYLKQNPELQENELCIIYYKNGNQFNFNQ